MTPITFFTLSILSLALLTITFFVKSPKQYFSTKEGRGVLTGIILAVAISVAIAFIFPNKVAAGDYEFFSTAELFVGLDQTNKVSPFCTDGANSNKLTSNIGAELSLIRLSSGLSDIRLKYNHHSCAVNPDQNSYDSVGITVKYVLF